MIENVIIVANCVCCFITGLYIGWYNSMTRGYQEQKKILDAWKMAEEEWLRFLKTETSLSTKE